MGVPSGAASQSDNAFSAEIACGKSNEAATKLGR